MRKLVILLVPFLLLTLVVVAVGCDEGTSATSTDCTANGIPWNEAKYHIGERTTVYGLVVDTRYDITSGEQPTFLNLGKNYPDPSRFTVVIWGRNRTNFPLTPESYYYGKNICVNGLITDYQGVAQIEVSAPSQIRGY
jgi:DNA/RNA endonuclease YhcR with UshA esterase domain